MEFLKLLLLVFCLETCIAEEVFKPIVPLVHSSRANNSVGKTLSFAEEDISAREAGYYQYPLVPPPYSPPVYGPPQPEYPEPEGNVEIEFLFNELTIECVVDKPLEHIIWTRFPCPNQLYFGEGIHVADGAVVYNEDLYDVQIRGFNGIFFSELTIRDPIGPDSSGLYRCEAWPHIHRNGNGYQQYGTYQYYTPVESDVFIIGGNSLLENCYGSLPSYGYGNKVAQAVSNKKPSTINANKISKIKENFKVKRNTTKSSIDRKETNAKYLKYNIQFDDSNSNTADKNTTFKGFLPFQFRRNRVMEPPKAPVSPHIVGNLSSSARFDFLGNVNNKTWQLKYKREDLEVEKGKNLTIESVARKFDFPRNKTIKY